jgi:hypothetical protein
MVVEKNRKCSQNEAPTKMAEKVLREAAKIMSQSVIEGEDGFIEKYCLVDWTSPPIYDIYPDEEKSLEKVISWIHTMCLIRASKIKPLI